MHVGCPSHLKIQSQKICHQKTSHRGENNAQGQYKKKKKNRLNKACVCTYLLLTFPKTDVSKKLIYLFVVLHDNERIHCYKNNHSVHGQWYIRYYIGISNDYAIHSL